MKNIFKTEYTVNEGYKGLLYKDGKFEKELEPGTHAISDFFNSAKWYMYTMDVRERSLVIKNQEVLTKDKVAIRVSVIVYFRVQNARDAMHNVSSYEERIYEDVQLAARRFLANESLEGILNARSEISTSVREEVKSVAKSYGVEIIKADVKDLVFPGNLREIMNQVIETERRAQAELINAQKEADVIHIKTKAENEASRLRNEADREAMKIRAEAEKERAAIQRESELEEVKLVQAHPEVLKIRKLKTLAELARGGGRFIIGLDQIGLGNILNDDSGK